MYFDTHAHPILLSRRDPQALQDLAARYGAELSGFIDIGTDVDDIEPRATLRAQIGARFWSAGLYPSHCTDEQKEPKLRKLAEIASSRPAGLVAIGEIGLDFHHEYGSLHEQSQLFEAQIEIANSAGLPIVVHSRNADDECYELLRRLKPSAGGVMHCFSSDLRHAKRMIDLGFAISFAGNITYKKTEGIREAAEGIPLDYVLAETDAPYLAPQSLRGSINNPGNVRHVYEFLSGLRKIPMEELAASVLNNVRSVFRIEPLE